MSWWGKVIGGTFGFALGGPLGAMLGAALGHSFDKGLSGIDQSEAFASPAENEKIQAAFFAATFSLMGRIAKADGQVTRDEINLAKATMARMQLNEEQTKAAKELFNEGKSEHFDVAEVAAQFKQVCGRRSNLIQIFLEIQIATALADGDLHTEEQATLLEISRILGVSRTQFEKLLALVVAQQQFAHDSSQHHAKRSADSNQHLTQAYRVLGLDSNCSDAELKRAYRRQISQHHPDKLVSKGLPEEMMRMATEKTREIKEAYELIKKNRSK